MNSPTDPADTPKPKQDMGILEHFQELRTRLLRSALAIFLFAIIGYMYATPLFRILAQPFFDAFPGETLIGTGPAEAFFIKMKVAIAFGIFASMPYLLLQIWLFVAPGLYPTEQKLFIPFLLASCGLFLIGAYFCYAVVLPFTLEFFRDQYLSIGLQPTIRLSEHLTLFLQTVIGFGAAFELPVLAFLLGRAGVLTSASLITAGRYAVVVIFALSAVLTPPDVITQFLMAGPLLLLYGISILVLRWTERKDEQAATK